MRATLSNSEINIAGCQERCARTAVGLLLISLLRSRNGRFREHFNRYGAVGAKYFKGLKAGHL
jgi:hypothetical protein